MYHGLARQTYGGLDSHKWPTKMEIQRLLCGKPDLKIKAMPSAHQAIRKSGD